MLTKEEYLSIIEDFEGIFFEMEIVYNFQDIQKLKDLIKEHFELVEHAKKLQDEVDKYKHDYFSMCDLVENPQPYKFEDLKPNMWVWDNKLKMCVEITDIIELEEENKKCVDYGFGYVEYKENHLFPVTKAMEYQGKEMKDDGKEK